MPLPVELPANWIFRISVAGQPELYARPVRVLTVMITVGAAVLLPLPLFVRKWGLGAALEMAGLETLVHVVLVQALFGRYHQIPFTSTYLPDKANLRIRLGWYVVAYLFFSTLVSHAIASALDGTTSAATVTSLLVISYLVTAARLKRYGRSAETVSFEEGSPEVLTLLGLGRE